MQQLPEPFNELDRYVERWAKSTERERRDQRIATPFDELTDFAAAVEPRLNEIVERLKAQPFETLAPSDRVLCNLAASYLEAAMAIQFYNASELPVGFPAERFHIKDVQMRSASGAAILTE